MQFEGKKKRSNWSIVKYAEEEEAVEAAILKESKAAAATADSSAGLSNTMRSWTWLIFPAPPMDRASRAAEEQQQEVCKLQWMNSFLFHFFVQ